MNKIKLQCSPRLDMQIVHERPQSLGLIRRANAILTDCLGKYYSTTHWSQGLGITIYSINTRTTHTTKKKVHMNWCLVEQHDRIMS